MGDTGDSPNEKGGWARPHTASQTSFPFDQPVRERSGCATQQSRSSALASALLTACGGSHHAAATQLLQ